MEMCQAANCNSTDNSDNYNGLFQEFAVTPLVIGIISMVVNSAFLVLQTKVELDSVNFFNVILIELCILVVALDVTNITRESLLSLIVNQDQVLVICKYSAILVMANIAGTGLITVAMLINQFFFLHRPLRYSTLFSRRKAFAFLVSFNVVLGINLFVVILIWDDNQPCTYYLNIPRWHHGIMVCMLFSPVLISGALRFSVIKLSRAHVRQIVALQINDVSDSPSQGTRDVVKRNRKGLAAMISIGIALSAHLTPLTFALIWYIVMPSDFHSSSFHWFSRIAIYLRFAFGFWIPPSLMLKSKNTTDYLKKLFSRLRRRDGMAR